MSMVVERVEIVQPVGDVEAEGAGSKPQLVAEEFGEAGGGVVSAVLRGLAG